VAGYAGNFVSSNDLFTPPAAGTNRKSAAQLGVHAACGGVNASAKRLQWSAAELQSVFSRLLCGAFSILLQRL